MALKLGHSQKNNITKKAKPLKSMERKRLNVKLTDRKRKINSQTKMEICGHNIRQNGKRYNKIIHCNLGHIQEKLEDYKSAGPTILENILVAVAEDVKNEIRKWKLIPKNGYLGTDYKLDT